MAAIALTGASLAQPPQSPDRKEVGSSKGPGQSTPILSVPVDDVRLSVDDIVARIMAFDKNKDGKVTKDELPERMRHRIDLGDTNKDGALDKEEIMKFATKLAAAPGESGLSSIVESDFRPEGGVGRPGPGPGPGRIEVVVNDLKLSGKKKELAIAAARAHQEYVRMLMEQARGELFQKMKEILTEEELKDFAAALDRPRDEVRFDRGAPGGVERKLDPPPPQKR